MQIGWQKNLEICSENFQLSTIQTGFSRDCRFSWNFSFIPFHYLVLIVSPTARILSRWIFSRKILIFFCHSIFNQLYLYQIVLEMYQSSCGVIISSHVTYLVHTWHGSFAHMSNWCVQVCPNEVYLRGNVRFWLINLSVTQSLVTYYSCMCDMIRFYTCQINVYMYVRTMQRFI